MRNRAAFLERFKVKEFKSCLEALDWMMGKKPNGMWVLVHWTALGEWNGYLSDIPPEEFEKYAVGYGGATGALMEDCLRVWRVKGKDKCIIEVWVDDMNWWSFHPSEYDLMEWGQKVISEAVLELMKEMDERIERLEREYRLSQSEVKQ